MKLLFFDFIYSSSNLETSFINYHGHRTIHPKDPSRVLAGQTFGTWAGRAAMHCNGGGLFVRCQPRGCVLADEGLLVLSPDLGHMRYLGIQLPESRQARTNCDVVSSVMGI